MLEILNAILNLNTIILVIGFSIGFYNYNYNRSDIYNTIVVYFFISLIFDIISLIFSLFFEDLIPKYLYTINHINLLIELFIFGFLFNYQIKLSLKYKKILQYCILLGIILFITDFILYFNDIKVSILGVYTYILISAMSIIYMFHILTIKTIPSLRNIYLMMIIIVFFSIFTIFNITQNIIINYD